tara:strand:- start:43 stop:441 length:399 start_codon:yes stop_codon:yes gene_type:complete
MSNANNNENTSSPSTSNPSTSNTDSRTDSRTDARTDARSSQPPIPPNTVFVGKKPVMSYAMSALIQLAQSGEITIKARGMVISNAVDVAEIVSKRLGNNAYEVKSVAIDTEKVGAPGEERNVSTIEIKLGRK